VVQKLGESKEEKKKKLIKGIHICGRGESNPRSCCNFQTCWSMKYSGAPCTTSVGCTNFFLWVSEMKFTH
jgi:hypothetical protein